MDFYILRKVTIIDSVRSASQVQTSILKICNFSRLKQLKLKLLVECLTFL